MGIVQQKELETVRKAKGVIAIVMAIAPGFNIANYKSTDLLRLAWF